MTREELLELLEPAVAALGYELVDVEVRVGGPNGLLRLFIDKAGGVNLADCERVSRQIGALLDAEDPIPGRYALEVSSPGLDRRLTRRADFERFAGRLVRLRARSPIGGQRRFKGRLQGMVGEEIVIEIDAEEIRLPFNDIDQARLVPEL
ncbi:MAG: ribosome maturation factor RimP [Gammaproteobacteria bacterium]|nr:ribosome maturation factor RimP [Gammaproteobacteria bacterium]